MPDYTTPEVDELAQRRRTYTDGDTRELAKQLLISNLQTERDRDERRLETLGGKLSDNTQLALRIHALTTEIKELIGK